MIKINDEVYLSIVEQLNDEIKRRGLTANKVANLSGIAATTVSAILNARSYPRLDTLILILNALDLKIKVYPSISNRFKDYDGGPYDN